MSATFTLGTRGSDLALYQTRWVADRIRTESPNMDVHIEIIETRGDAIRDVPLAEVGGKGIFTKELEYALLEKRIDAAVHSLKDMPTEFPEGLVLGAIPCRGNARDALVCRKATSLDTLPQGATVGTSSLRRAAQVRAYRPDLRVLDLRGNVETRVRRVDEGVVDAAILACAGLERLGRTADIAEAISPEIMVPAPGQGALAVEIRFGDSLAESVASWIHDSRCAAEVVAERRCLAVLEGGCQAPIGAYAITEHDDLILTAIVCSPDGSASLRTTMQGPVSDPLEVGEAAARDLLERGAADIIAAAR